uniref:SKICH domain-containing protein n=1 Tax=Timema poppense TaxID=170557 RepID=A0A7R9H4F3_TIMPO|nr:unnamed protein product [Timema poppensis]
MCGVTDLHCGSYLTLGPPFHPTIILPYHIGVSSSSRDWVGLFPRGWVNLQQYVTFEWTDEKPYEEVTLRRNLLFCSKYHAQLVFTEREYQFVFVNKQIKVLGKSGYFNFLLAEKMAGLLKYDFIPFGLDVDYLGVKPAHHTCTCVRAIELERNARSNLTMQLKSELEINQHLKERLDTAELELKVSVAAQNKLKLAAHQVHQEKLAYQKFVSEMLFALSRRGIVKVIDSQGVEILVQKVSSQAAQADPQINTSAKMSHRERLLKAVIGSQEQTIRELLRRLEDATKAKPVSKLNSDMSLLDLEDTSDTDSKITETGGSLSDSEDKVKVQDRGDIVQSSRSFTLRDMKAEPFKNVDVAPTSLVAIVPHHQSVTPPAKTIECAPNIANDENSCAVFDDDGVSAKHELQTSEQKNFGKLTGELNVTAIGDYERVCDEGVLRGINASTSGDDVHSDNQSETKTKPVAFLINGDHMQYAIVR